MACVDENQVKNNYERDLKACEHHREMLRTLSYTKLYNIAITFLHEVFESGRFSGTKLLDIGSGPTLHNVASASSHFSNIVVSDFVEDNCQELRRWLKGESDLDWSDFFNIVADLEGYNKNLVEGRRKIELRVRNAVKAVRRCDLFAESVLATDQLNELDTKPPYDVVMSMWCFESTAPSVDSYKEILKKVNRLLRDGGGLIISGYLNCGIWYTGKKQHHHLKISEQEVIQSLEDAGFELIEFINHKREDLVESYRYESLFCLTAVKK